MQYRFIRVYFNAVTQYLFRIFSPVVAGIQIRKIDARRRSAWLEPERQQESRLRLIQIAGIRVHVAEIQMRLRSLGNGELRGHAFIIRAAKCKQLLARQRPLQP